MTSSTKVGLPVTEIPVAGFGKHSDLAHQFRDETVDERRNFELENGYRPEKCRREFPEGGRGYCTRPQGHVVNGDNGMHLAGGGEYIVGAW